MRSLNLWGLSKETLGAGVGGRCAHLASEVRDRIQYMIFGAAEVEHPLELRVRHVPQHHV